MGNLCFPFDSWCFLFSSASHFLGKPAVLISDTHVSRAPLSLKVNRLSKEFPHFFSDMHGNLEENNLVLLQD